MIFRGLIILIRVLLDVLFRNLLAVLYNREVRRASTIEVTLLVVLFFLGLYDILV
jgi:hypothetical protein